VAALVHQLSSPELQQRRDAARELAEVDPMLPDVIEALAQFLETAEANDASQRYAILGLAKAGSRAVPAVAQLLDSPNPVTREAASEVLGRMAPSAPATWPILIAYFKRAHPDSWGVADELARAGPPVVPLLRQALKDPDPHTRMGAAATLAEMGDFARMYAGSSADARPQTGIAFATSKDLAPAASELSRALSDPDASVRNWAAIALAYAAPADARSIPILVALLDERSSMISAKAIAALQNMGSTAQPAVPRLERALASNQDFIVRVGAARALVLASGVRACTPLAHAVTNDKDGNVRVEAARSLIAVRPPCPQAVTVLLKTLGNRQYSATDEIAKIGNPAVPGLTAALKSPNLYVREDAVATLAKITPISIEAKRALMLALKDKSLDVRSAAASALQNAGGKAERAASAEQAQEEKIYAQASKQDRRKHTRREIMAPIPPDPDHKYPLTLSYLVPVAAIGEPTGQARILVTLYTGEDRPERLVFWKKVGNDAYQQLRIIEPEDPDFGEGHYETPNIFRAKVRILGQGHPWEEAQLFVDVPVDGWRSHIDQVFAVAHDELHAVEIQSAQKWYEPRLRPRETIGDPAENRFSDKELGFSLFIWNADDPVASPTAGRVTGTYQIIQQTQAGGPFAGFAPAAQASGIPRPATTRKMVVGSPQPVTTWKMVVVGAKRGPA